MSPISPNQVVGMPEQTLVLDRMISQVNPQKAFYLRVVRQNGFVDHVELDNARNIRHARRMAKRLGYRPIGLIQLDS